MDDLLRLFIVQIGRNSEQSSRLLLHIRTNSHAIRHGIVAATHAVAVLLLLLILEVGINAAANTTVVDHQVDRWVIVAVWRHVCLHLLHILSLGGIRWHSLR